YAIEFPSHPFRDLIKQISFPTRRSSDLAHQRRIQAGIRLRPERRRGRRAGGLLRPYAGGRLPEMRLAGVRAWPELCVRKVGRPGDRKSTRLNSSHVKISYAVFFLKKKNT